MYEYSMTQGINIRDIVMIGLTHFVLLKPYMISPSNKLVSVVAITCVLFHVTALGMIQPFGDR